MTGQDAAVYVRLRALRESIRSVARLHESGDAGGSHSGIVAGIRGKPRYRRRVGRRLQDALDVVGGLLVFELGHAFKVGASDGVQLEREWRMLQAAESVGDVVNRIVGNR